MLELEGKVAVVTGASRGIGRACALKLAEHGAKVAFNYLSNEAKAKEVHDLIASRYQQESMYLSVDIREKQQAEQMFKTVLKAWGRVDILVNNAGINRDNLVLMMKESEWNDVIQTNLNGLFHCTKPAARIMLKQKQGKIINLTSVVGQVGNIGQANYATTKAGIIAFTKTVAQELATRNILVNAVAPGYIQSDMTEQLSEQQCKEILQNIPLNRFGLCEEVAEVVLFLASDRCKYITGQTINIDGGMVMK